MKHFFIAAALFTGMATASSAQLLHESATLWDRGETHEEENQEFVGNPVFDIDMNRVGTVVAATGGPNQQRRIQIEFVPGYAEGFTGMYIGVDPIWESSGRLEFQNTRGYIISYLNRLAARADADVIVSE